MGSPPDQLHDSYEQAKARMKALRHNCPQQLCPESKKLLDVFTDIFLADEEAIREATLSGFISKRMQQYLKAERRRPGTWPALPLTDDIWEPELHLAWRGGPSQTTLAPEFISY